MKTARSRRSALVKAGFTKEQYPGERTLDVDAVAESAQVSRQSVYSWINGTAGRFVDTMIEKALESRQRRAG